MQKPTVDSEQRSINSKQLLPPRVGQHQKLPEQTHLVDAPGMPEQAHLTDALRTPKRPHLTDALRTPAQTH